MGTRAAHTAVTISSSLSRWTGLSILPG